MLTISKIIRLLLNILYVMAGFLNSVTIALKQNVIMPTVASVDNFLDRTVENILDNNPLMKMD